MDDSETAETVVTTGRSVPVSRVVSRQSAAGPEPASRPVPPLATGSEPADQGVSRYPGGAPSRIGYGFLAGGLGPSPRIGGRALVRL